MKKKNQRDKLGEMFSIFSTGLSFKYFANVKFYSCAHMAG